MLVMYCSNASTVRKTCQLMTHYSCHIIWVPGGISMSYVFDPEVVLHWDLFQKESPGSS